MKSFQKSDLFKIQIFPRDFALNVPALKQGLFFVFHRPDLTTYRISKDIPIYSCYDNKRKVKDICYKRALLFNKSFANTNEDLASDQMQVMKGHGFSMKVDIQLSPDVAEAYAVIYTPEITTEIAELAGEFSKYGESGPLIGRVDEKMVIVQPGDIYLVRVENEKTYLVCKDQTYRSNKRLYELSEILGNRFLQISKSALANLKYMDSVEPSFNGVMLLHMKNGESEYISRKFVPALKKYLGI